MGYWLLCAGYQLLEHLRNVFPVRYEPNLYILPTECIYVFRMILTANSDCFPKRY
jgi:hypothetical protein